MSTELKIELFDFRPLREETKIVLTLDGVRIAELTSEADPSVSVDVQGMLTLAKKLYRETP